MQSNKYGSHKLYLHNSHSIYGRLHLWIYVGEGTLMNQPKQTDMKKKNIISSFQHCRMNEDFITTSRRHSDSLCVSPRHTQSSFTVKTVSSPSWTKKRHTHSYRMAVIRPQNRTTLQNAVVALFILSGETLDADITVETADIITDMNDSRRQQPRRRYLAASSESVLSCTV